MITARVVIIDRLFDQTQAKHANIEIQVLLGIAGDGGYVMEPRDFQSITWVACGFQGRDRDVTESGSAVSRFFMTVLR